MIRWVGGWLWRASVDSRRPLLQPPCAGGPWNLPWGLCHRICRAASGPCTQVWLSGWQGSWGARHERCINACGQCTFVCACAATQVRHLLSGIPLPAYHHTCATSCWHMGGKRGAIWVSACYVGSHGGGLPACKHEGSPLPAPAQTLWDGARWVQQHPHRQGDGSTDGNPFRSAPRGLPTPTSPSGKYCTRLVYRL